MAMILDFVLGFAALAAGAYCLVLSRRLRALSRIDGSVGGAVAVLSAQVDQLTRVLGDARAASASARSDLGAQTARAEAAVRRLEMLMASLHDVEHEPAPVFSRGAAPVSAAPRPDVAQTPQPSGRRPGAMGPSAVAPRSEAAFWRTSAEAPPGAGARAESGQVWASPDAAHDPADSHPPRVRIQRRARRAGAEA